MTSTMSAGDLLWVEATRDVEAEHEAAILASASVAAAPLWATVLASESDADFHNRVALLETSIQAVASSIAPMGTPDHSLVVTALPAQWYEDWQLAFQARQAESQRVNAPRAYQRSQARAAAKTAEFETGWVDKKVCETCQGKGRDAEFNICSACGGHGYIFSQDKTSKKAYKVDGYDVKAPGKDWVHLDTDDYEEVEAAVKKMSTPGQPSSVIHVKNLFNNSITVFIVSGWGGGSIESVQSYEQFYGHPYTGSKMAAAIPGVDCAGSGEGVRLPEGDKAVLCPHCGNSFSAEQWGTYTALGETYVGLPVHLAQGKTLDDRIRATQSLKTAKPGWWSEGVVGKQMLGFPGSKIIDVEPTVGYLMNGPVSDPGYYDEAAGGMVTFDFAVKVKLEDGREVSIGKPYRWLEKQQAAPGATVTSAREDYEHWNEDADRIWWEEEGRHGGDSGTYYCDVCGYDHAGPCPMDSYEASRKTAASGPGTGAHGWPFAPNPTPLAGAPDTNWTLSCPDCGSTAVTMSTMYGPGGRLGDPGAMEVIECRDCGKRDMKPSKPLTATKVAARDYCAQCGVAISLGTAIKPGGEVYSEWTHAAQPPDGWGGHPAQPSQARAASLSEDDLDDIAVTAWLKAQASDSEPENIALCRKVLAEGFYAAGGQIDQFSASAIVQVYDALGPDAKAKYGAMSLEKMADVAFKLMNKASSKTATESDPGQCRHGWRSDQCPYRYDDSAPMGACGGRSKTAAEENSFPPKNDVTDQAAADPAPAAPGAPQQAADPLVDVATAQVGGVIMEPGDGVVNTYTINDVQDAGDSMLLTVTKNGGEEMQLQVPKTEKLQIHQPDAPKEKPEAKPAEATPAAGEEKEKSPFPPKASSLHTAADPASLSAGDRVWWHGEDGNVIKGTYKGRSGEGVASGFTQSDAVEVEKDGGGVVNVGAQDLVKGEPPSQVAASKTAATIDGLDIPVKQVDGDEKPTETRIVPAAQSEGKYKVEGKFSDGWKNLMPDVATKEECEEWLRTTTMFGLNAKSSILDRVIDRAARLVLANGNPYTDDNPYAGENAQAEVLNPSAGDAPAERSTDVPDPEKTDD